MPNTTVDQLSEKFAAFRPILLKAKVEAETKYLAVSVADMIDNQLSDRPLTKAYSNLVSRQQAIEATGKRDPRADFEFATTLWNHAGTTFGKVFCEHHEWYQSWMTFAGLSDFDFWDHTDRPEDISSAVWDMRRAVWAAIANGTDVSFVVKFDLTTEPPTAGDVLKHLPDARHRAMTKAKQLYSAELFDSDMFADTMSGTKRALAVLDYMQSDAGFAVLESKVVEIIPTLVTITEEMILGKA